MYFGDRHIPVLHLVGLLVLTLKRDQVSAITRFDHTTLERFKLPRTLTAAEWCRLAESRVSVPGTAARHMG